MWTQQTRILTSARHGFQVVEDAIDAVPAKRTVEKEDGSDGDEPESLRCITLDEPCPTKIQPGGALSCDLHQGRLNLEADALRAGQEVCQKGGPPGPGSHVDEHIVARHTRSLQGLRHRRNRARQVWNATARELGIVIRDLVEVKQQVEPPIALPWGDAIQFGPEHRRSDLVAQQTGPYQIRSIPKRRLHSVHV